MEDNVILLSQEQRAEHKRFVKSGVHGAHSVSRAGTILALDRTRGKIICAKCEIRDVHGRRSIGLRETL